MIIHPSTLIFAPSEDAHTLAVLAAIRSDASPLVIDFSRYGVDFTASTDLSSDSAGCIETRRGDLFELDRVQKIWWRRPQPFTNSSGVEAQLLHFAAGETVSAWRGMLSGLASATWYNHFDADRVAERKVQQLIVAKSIGFSIPATCVTSNPARAKDFVNHGPSQKIFKSFGGSPAFWQPVRKYKPEYEVCLEALPQCPAIFQEYIEGIDYRIVCIDEAIFAAEKDVTGSKYPFDVRVTRDIDYKPSELPDEISSLLRIFMKRFNLRYGAFDLRKTRNGDFVFLEINPAGQFLYIEMQTGLPITSAMARALAPSGDIYVEGARGPHADWLPGTDVFSDVVPDRVETHTP